MEELDCWVANPIVRLDEVLAKARALRQQANVMRTETERYRQEQAGLERQIAENKEKVKMNKQLPVSSDSPWSSCIYHIYTYMGVKLWTLPL